MMQTINLTQNNFKMSPVVYMVQNDTGRELKMILDDVTLDGTETGAVAIKRSDGSYYTITATLVAADNAFTIDADQALTQPGKTECQLKVTDSNNDVISSYTFIIMIQPSTDGVPEEQLGYSIQDLMDAAQTIMSGGFTPEIKAALLQIASKVAYIDEDGQDYYDALDTALNPPADLVSISAVYTQSGTVFDTDSLDSLKADLVVTALYSDTTSETVPSASYTLSGTLTEGTSTITVSYGGKTATFTVTVTSVHLVYYSGYTIDTAAGIRIQNNNNTRDRTPIMQDAGEHFVPYVNAVSGSTDSGGYPIPITADMESVTVTSVGNFELFVVSWSSAQSRWNRANSTNSNTSGTTVSLSSYAGSSYYLVVLILKSGATSENTTITYS